MSEADRVPKARAHDVHRPQFTQSQPIRFGEMKAHAPLVRHFEARARVVVELGARRVRRRPAHHLVEATLHGRGGQRLPIGEDFTLGDVEPVQRARVHDVNRTSGLLRSPFDHACYSLALSKFLGGADLLGR